MLRSASSGTSRPATSIDLPIERVVQLEHEVGRCGSVGRAASAACDRAAVETVRGTGALLARGRVDTRRNAVIGKANVRRIEVLGRVLAVVAPAHRDQRHAQAVGVVVVLQALDLVVADELEAVDVVVVPAGAVHARRRTSRCGWPS